MNGTVKVNGSAVVQNLKKQDNYDYVVQIVPLSNSEMIKLQKIMGYGDYQIGNVTISRVFTFEGLWHNLFFSGTILDSNLEVALSSTYRLHSQSRGVDFIDGDLEGDNFIQLSTWEL
ncbi:hypothetical protein Tco_0662395 [Tanacetum coccineum]